MRWKWNNVPIPQAHVIGLVIGAVLHISFSKHLTQLPWLGHVIGWPLILIGISLCAWSVMEAKEMNIANPNRLLKSGPYAFSRNPMYVGWTLIYLGISFASNSFWILSLLPIVLIYIHFVDIRKEEQYLDEQFGDEYAQYKKQVRRFL
jgi:protein-S-isoprenylcysteine O-methyltransferase Ste14